MSIRTTTDGTSTTPHFRYTSGQPDGLNLPNTGTAYVGKPPMLWMTGGDISADSDPATIGMDRILNDLCDVGNFAIMQPNTPYFLGNDTAVARINAAVTWARANLGATNDPPIIGGTSNGWYCSIIYARQFPVTGVWGVLPVTAGIDGYLDQELEDNYSLRTHIKNAWGTPAGNDPHNLPPRFSAYDDIHHYPTSLFGKIIAWYSACDPLLVPQQMSFAARMRMEVHNIGNTGHLGPLFDSTEPCAGVDTTRLRAFFNERIAAL